MGIANGGIDTEQDYPYTAQDGTCDKTKESKHVVSISSYNDVPQNNEQQLAAAVAKGPVSVAIEADQQSFQMYSSGASWGDQGYIMMKRGVSSSGICGIAMQPSYPVASSGPSPPSPPSPSPPSPSPPSPPSPGGNYDYEDPNNGGCHSDEQAIQVEGLPGSFCSPSCGILKPCSKNVPPGTTAQPEGVLESQGSSNPTNCALICNPGQGGCPVPGHPGHWHLHIRQLNLRCCSGAERHCRIFCLASFALACLLGEGFGAVVHDSFCPSTALQ